MFLNHIYMSDFRCDYIFPNQHKRKESETKIKSLAQIQNSDSMFYKRKCKTYVSDFDVNSNLENSVSKHISLKLLSIIVSYLLWNL